MRKLKIAVIGQGRSGRNIHGTFFKSEANDVVEVVAVVEWDAERRARAKLEYPGCEVYEDYTGLFARKDLDLVVNASYSRFHYSITKDLLQHGFNVLVEKPFARNYYECSDLINTAKANGVLLAVFQQSFLAPYYTMTKEMMENGKLGEIQQVSLRWNGFCRRWDWQTLQTELAGSVYNTGPHPIGIGVALLGYDDRTQVVYSKLARTMTCGDGEDYAKIILSCPDKPVVDIEINSCDAFSDYNVKLQGTRGTFVCTTNGYKMKYIVDGENPERQPIRESLSNEDGTPAYCSENLITHEESGEFAGTAFDSGTGNMYRAIRETLLEGKAFVLLAENMAKIVSVMETVHAQNPMPILFN